MVEWVVEWVVVVGGVDNDLLRFRGMDGDEIGCKLRGIMQMNSENTQ